MKPKKRTAVGQQPSTPVQTGVPANTDAKPTQNREKQDRASVCVTGFDWQHV